MTTRRDEILARLETIGRPRVEWFPLREFHASTARQQTWDAEHHAKHLEYIALCAELETLDAATEDAAREVAAKRAAARRVETSGATPRAVEAARTPKDTQALAAAKAWLATVEWALVLAGDVGAGKTVAASWALVEYARRGTVASRKCGEVLRLSNFGDGALELARLKSVGLLVLDDVGAEQLDDRGRGLLVELLDARYEARARTVLTANPSWPQLQVRLGVRLADRLIDGGRVVELRGKSLRGGPEAPRV